ncbi:MAG: endonuclease/exonuclease/phosphatase family protein [Saprospiraceae bacterium]|nr:endonuclease/exonuclease/phosphatase family protein [Saprospiraceae bacterium]
MLHWIKDTMYKMLFGFNIVASLLLLCVYMAPHIPPSHIYWFAFLAIGYPYLFFLNLFFAFWWLYKRKRFFYLSTLVLIIGFQHFFNFWGLNYRVSEPTTDSIGLMSYNVHYFNSTNLINEIKLNIAEKKILTTIKKHPIDIFCGQEFAGKTKAYTEKAIAFLSDTIGLKHSYTAGGSSLAIFSKYPIRSHGKIDFEGSYNGAIYADIQYKQQLIRVYCFHLQSIRLGMDENEIFKSENLSSIRKNKTLKKYKRIENKLKQAFLLREEQAKYVSKHIQKSPYPVLVCGDLNDTPSSYAYNQLSHGLKDSFTEKGTGFGSTYAGSLPFLRIDYIFTSPNLKIDKFEVIPNATSDHYPISVYLRL